MKSITDYETSDPVLLGSELIVNKTSQFFARFDKLDFSSAHKSILSSLAQSSGGL